MKILLVFMVLYLQILQQTTCNHVETCECYEIKALLNATLVPVISRLESKTGNETLKVNAMIEDAIIRLESKFNDAMKSRHNETDTLLKQIERQLSYPTCNPLQPLHRRHSPSLTQLFRVN